MTDATQTTNQIWRAGIEALRDRLGPAGMIRFLQQYDSGRGDYTRDRREWLGQLTPDEIRKSIEARRNDSGTRQ